MRVAQGRGFAPEDFVGKPWSVMVNEAFARKHYPGDDPDLAAKIEFGLMGYDVRWAHIRVRAAVRARERG